MAELLLPAQGCPAVKSIIPLVLIAKCFLFLLFYSIRIVVLQNWVLACR